MEHKNRINNNSTTVEINRRRFIGYFTALGLGATILPETLTCTAQDNLTITSEMVASAARIAGVQFSEEELEKIAEDLSGKRGFVSQYEMMREAKLGNGVYPSIVFNPMPPGFKIPTIQRSISFSTVSVIRPETDDDLAFLPITHLAELVKTQQITATELTKFCIARLKKYDPVLFCVVTLTEDLALKQAKKADEEIAAGLYRGPLHGIPYGLKDLFSVTGYRTTWGALPFQNQELDIDATVYTKLSEAGAILVAKLASGALASGANWFKGTTRNPWNPKLNAYGSSCGPASAVAAGLVGFAIGTETAGSITSPAAACGLSGLRPSFGRISRYGCMALTWTMDKVGPLCRSAEDCAVVFNVLVGPDEKDNTLIDVPFNWDGSTDLSGLRIGLWNRMVEREDPVDEDHELTGERFRYSEKMDTEAVSVLKSLGAKVVPLNLPEMPSYIFSILFNVESSAAFDELMRSGRVDMMKKPPENSSYPSSLRLGRFIPGVEYLQANRIRTRLIRDFHESIKEFDLLIGSDIYLTNLTGHPEMSVPHGFYKEGLPTTLRFTGKLFGETEMLKVAHAFQSRTDYHLKHPRMR